MASQRQPCGEASARAEVFAGQQAEPSASRGLSARQEAEAVEQFGEDLAKLIKAFDRVCDRMSSPTIGRINAIPDQEHLDTVAAAFRTLGDQLCRDCDQADEADDRRRDNPLEPDYRRLGQGGAS